jgi:hypothetical protein
MKTFEQFGEVGPESGEPPSGDESEKGDRPQRRGAESDGASRPSAPSQGNGSPRRVGEPQFRTVNTPIPPEILARRGELRHLLTQLLCRVHGKKRRGERKAA